MAISDNQKIDYLFKKLGYGATKTDTNANKLAANEAIQVHFYYVAIKYGQKQVTYQQ